MENNWVKRSFENAYANMALYELSNIKEDIEDGFIFLANLTLDFFFNWMKKCNNEDQAVLIQIYEEEIESLL